MGASQCCHREKCKNHQSTIHSITLCFGHEDLVKTKLLIKVDEKKKGKLSITVEKSKISN